MPKSVESLAISPLADGYVLQIEDEDGEMLELIISNDQLDLLAEEIDRHIGLDMDDAALPDDDDEETDQLPS